MKRQKTQQENELPSSPAEEEEEEEARRLYRRKRRYVRIGQLIMLVGGLVAVIHWGRHFALFGFFGPMSQLEMAIGYPVAGVIVIAGAIVSGRK